MKPLTITALVILLSMATPVTVTAEQPRQGTDARWTNGMMNGLMWQQMDAMAKIYFVAGVLELSSTIDPKVGGAIDVAKCKCNAGDLILGVDAFYQNAGRRFLRLPVTMALSMDAQRRSGVPPETLARVYLALISEIEAMESSPKE